MAGVSPAAQFRICFQPTDRRPHDHVDRLVEAISEGELLKRGWQHDLVDRPIKIIPEREMLERRRPHDPVDRPVETSSER